MTVVNNRSEVPPDERRTQCSLPSFVIAVNADAVVCQARLEGRESSVVIGKDLKAVACIVVVVVLAETANARCALPVSSCRRLPEVKVVVDTPAIVLHTGGKIVDIGRGLSHRDCSITIRLGVATGRNVSRQKLHNVRRHRRPPRVVDEVAEGETGRPTVRKDAVVMPARHEVLP